MATLVKVLQQSAVIGSDVDNEIRGFEAQQAICLFVKVGEIGTQDPCRTTQVGVFRRKQDVGIDFEPDLHQSAVTASKQFQRICRLLDWPSTDLRHRIDRRNESDKQDRRQMLATANLAVVYGARSGNISVIAHRSC